MTYGQGGFGQQGGYYQQPPGGYYQQPPSYNVRPGVLTWFTVYCVLMALIYALVAVGGAIILSSPELFEEGPRDPEELKIRAIAMLVVGIALMPVFAIALALPRRPWVWIYDLVLICVGFLSCCFWPISIPLLIFWIKPDARAWFGRGG
jgi:cell division protein FtsW (lipid II flippase)